MATSTRFLVCSMRITPPFSDIIASVSIGARENRARNSGSVLLGTGIWVRIIGQTGKIIHAGIQRKRNSFALLKRHVAVPKFNFGIGALVNPCEHLHFNLCIAEGLSEFPHS